MKWEDIDLKGRTSGTFKTICPGCSHTRKKKKDPCLSVNLDKGVAKCWHCDEVVWKEEKQDHKSYELPPQTWQNFTNLRDRVVKWFKSRGISQQTLIANKITQEDAYIPAEGAQVRCVVFNYFEGGKLLNKKYRSAKKQFTQTKGAKKTFYGINDIVDSSEVFVVEGECFPPETEILTENGWVRFGDYLDQKVLQVNDDDTSDFVHPTAIVKKEYNDDLVLLANQKGYSSISTKGHNYIVDFKNKRKKLTANDIYEKNSIPGNIPRTLKGISNNGVDLSDSMLRFAVMVSADFSIRKGGDYYAGVKKVRKVDRFKALCEDLNIRYSCNAVKDEYYSLFVHRGQSLEFTKLFPMRWIGELSLRQMKVVLDEILFWDGNSVPNRNQIEYSSKEIHNATFIQTLAHICGYCSTIIPRQNEFGKWFKVSILFGKTKSSTQKSLKRSKVPYSGPVYCVSVPSGKILTRYNNCITIIGNCDKLAMYEIGVTNCISVPNGAKDLNDIFDTCEKYIKGVEKFYIAVDMDEPGLALEKELIKRLGKYRCERIEFKGKDANEDLIAGCLEESIKNSKPYPVEGTFTANDISDDLDNLYKNGLDDPLSLKGAEWVKFNSIFKPMLGQLTVVTGIPGHGKSNWVEWYCLSLLKDNDLKVSFFSPEHLPMQLHHAQLSEKYTGRPFYRDLSVSRMSWEDKENYKKWSSERVFLTVPERGARADWDWLFHRFEEQIFRYGVDVFVIDAFNKVLRNNPDSIGEISEVLSRLTLFCQTHNVHVFLVAHPTKMRKMEDGLTYQMPTLYDVKGSGDFYDQAHNGITVYRNFEGEYTTVVPTKIKFKHQGQVGQEVIFQFNVCNGRYHEFGAAKNFSQLDQSQTEPVQAEIRENPVSKEHDDFEVTDDLPF